jgi:uncharacterized protein (TIGR02452 family)
MNENNQKENRKEWRAEIFRQTVEIVNSGGYILNGRKIAVDKTEIAANTEFFDVGFSLKEIQHSQNTKFSVIEADCLEVAELLLKAGFNPCVLNMASGRNPGGGVWNGSGAQEENLFRRSNLFDSLYQFADYATQYGITKHKKQYPLDRNFGGIYSKNVTIFRSSENSGYALLSSPFQVSVVSVPAINRPELTEMSGKLYIARHLIEPTKEKMRAILRIAGKYEHDALVLSAFGCGAFCNPPEHIALLFKEVFAENEFINRFALVVFAIINDYNSHRAHNPTGNFEPFRKIFAFPFEIIHSSCAPVAKMQWKQ